MAVTINASTSAGLISTADTSGILQLQTANTTALTVDASQNVGVGTASPGFKFDVNGTFGLGTGQTGNIGVFGANTATGDTYFKLRNTAGAFDIGTSATGHYFYGQGSLPLQFFTNATERARIDTSGNVLVNTTSSTASTGQTAKLQVAGGIRTTTGFTSSISLGTIAQNATTTAAVGYNGVWLISQGGEAFALFNVVLSGGGTKTQLIFSSGSDIVCGTTSEPSGGTYLRLWISGGVLQIKNVNAYTGPWFLTPIATFGS
jgi:hypothetical protein